MYKTIDKWVSRMDGLEELKTRMETLRPASWEQLPDLALYMDQLISYMPRQLIHFEEGDALTSAMVNNYIKDGLLPRAEGKRYGREHLAWLTAICALKPVLSMRELSTLFAGLGDTDMPAQDRYAYFLQRLDRALDKAAKSLELEEGETALAALALNLALDSYASKLACQRVVEILAQTQAPKGDGGANKKKK